MFFAINIDVKTSRTHNNRDLIQKKLLDLCQTLNQHHIISKFDIILGDEVQGVIDYMALPKIFKELINFELKESLAIYIGIGYGFISTTLNYQDVEKNDGPCFHEARKAINQAKKNGMPDLVIGNQELESVEDLLNLYWKFYKNLSPRAHEILSLIKNEQTQTEIAKALNTQQSSISKTISRYNIVELIKLDKHIYTQLKLLKEAKWL